MQGGRNIVGQQHPTMLGVVGTCCVRLHRPLRLRLFYFHNYVAGLNNQYGDERKTKQYVCTRIARGNVRGLTPPGGGYFGVKRIGITVGNPRKLS